MIENAMFPGFLQDRKGVNLGWPHPEQSRSSGGAKDLARIASCDCTRDSHSTPSGVAVSLSGQALATLVKARGFGMTPQERGSGGGIIGCRHPEQSRSSGGAKDLARIASRDCTRDSHSTPSGVAVSLSGQALAPLVKARGFGMTPQET